MTAWLAGPGGLLLTTAPVRADSGTQPTPVAMTGTLIESTGASLRVRSDDGTSHTFEVDERTTVPPGLLVGSRIKVEYLKLDRKRRQLTKASPAEATSSTLAGPASPDPLPSPAPSPSPSPEWSPGQRTPRRPGA